MIFSGDIRSYRIDKPTRIIPPPVDIAFGVVVPLHDGTAPSSTTLDEKGIPYEVDNENNIIVYYVVSRDFDWGTDYGTIIPEDTLARQVVDYLYSTGVNFVIAIVPIDNPSSASDFYSSLKVPFDVNPANDLENKEFLKRDIDFIFVAFPEPSEDDLTEFSSLISQVKDHVSACSNKLLPSLDEGGTARIGQLERYFIFGISPRNTSAMEAVYNSVKADKEATRRFVMLTGNYGLANLPSILDGGRYTYEINNETYDFTWSLTGIPFALRYITSVDFAMPLTNKVISGITLSGIKIGMYKLADLFNNYGTCLLTVDYSGESPTCYRSNNIAYAVNRNGGEGNLYSYPEDAEFTIMFLEDTMDKVNRDFLRRFRGQRLSGSILKIIEDNFKRYVLDDYLNAKRWIEAYRNVKFELDKNDPTILKGYYEYRPVYPINKIWVKHFFIV